MAKFSPSVLPVGAYRVSTKNHDYWIVDNNGNVIGQTGANNQDTFFGFISLDNSGNFLPTAGIFSSVTIVGTGALRGSYGAGGVTSNFAAGDGALNGNTTGNGNTGVGLNTLGTSNGNNNTAVGNSSLGTNLVGINNAAFGSGTLYSNTGSNNTAAGYNSGVDNTSGSNNSYYGFNAGRGITTGSGNSILGANVTGLATGLTNNIILASSSTIRAQYDGTNWLFAGAIRTTGYTVSTLPTGVQGMRAFVTDATAPTFLGTAVGGGAAVSPVFYNGTAWVTA